MLSSSLGVKESSHLRGQFQKRWTHYSPVVESELLNNSLHLVYLLWVRQDFFSKGHPPFIVSVG